jgi:phospholipid/cholesterol/gamma-HCH transport system substrate-binding protein
MSKPFKFRYVNEVVGLFVILSLLLLIGVVLFAGHAQEWFVPKHMVYVKFPDKGTAGLKTGAEVEILETQAGRLEQIRINDDGSMIGEISINGRFIRFVRQDSEAIIKKRFAVAGDSFIEITRGTGEVLPEDDRFIPIKKDDDVTEMIQDIVVQVEDAVIPFMQQVEHTLYAYEAVATNITSPEGAVQKILRSVQELVDDVADGKGAAGMLLRDPQTADEVQEILASFNQLSQELVKVGEDVKAITASVKQTTDSELPQLGREATQAIEEARRTLEGLQRHWLLRGSMELPQSEGRLSPENYQPQLKGETP